MELALSFHSFKKDKIYVYIKNFGGIYASRTKDGMTLGYLDSLRKIGREDHVTVFYNSEIGFTGLHRKIVDNESTVYMRYSMEYIKEKNGLKTLLRDLFNDEKTPGYMKGLLLLVFFEIRLFFRMGLKKTFLLSNSKAKDLKMKSPCIFIETGFVGKIQLALFSKFLPLLRLYSDKKFADNPTRGFKEKKFPGANISKKKLADITLGKKSLASRAATVDLVFASCAFVLVACFLGFSGLFPEF